MLYGSKYACGLGPQKHRREAFRAIQQDRSLLYAIRTTDGLIKIGCSVDVADRILHIPHTDVLAMTPGDLDDERELHKSLIGSRHHGREWYNVTPEVLAAVNEMRQYFNLDPIAA